MTKPVLFMKAHVDAYTRRDGTVVQAHDTKVIGHGEDLGAGDWRTGHRAQVVDPAHPASGQHGVISGRGIGSGKVILRTADGKSHNVHADKIQPVAPAASPVPATSGLKSSESRLVKDGEMHADASKLGVNAFLDKYVAELLPAHMKHGITPANVVHDRVSPHAVSPSEYDEWDEMHGRDAKSQAHMANLAQKIHAGNHDEIGPVLLNGHKDDDRLMPEVIDGHHRTFAHQQAGAQKMNVIYTIQTLAALWHRINKSPLTVKGIVRSYENVHLPSRASVPLTKSLPSESAMNKTPVIFLKAHVGTYTRSDGAVVQAHETKVQAHPADIGAGIWNVGHKVKLHAPGHAMHGREGHITAPGHERGFVNVRGADNVTHSMNSHDIRPATGHSWPDLETGKQEVKAPAAPAHSAPKEGDVGHEEFKNYGKYFRKGDKVRDQYGKTHEVMEHHGPSVSTYSGQSFHPTKLYHADSKPAAAPAAPAKTKAKPAAKPALDPHPNVIGKATDVPKSGMFMKFGGKAYGATGKSGKSLHDGTAVDEYEHEDSGHKVWKDAQHRVHADSREEAKKIRGD